MSLPAAPTNVTVVPGVAQATVSWTPSTTAGITGYKVFCNPDNKLPNLATANATSLVVTKLKNGTPCTFRVHAINAAGISATSAPSVPGPPPAAPKVTARRGSGSGVMMVDMLGKPQKGSSLTYYNLSVAPPAPAAVIPTNVPATAVTFAGSAIISGLTNGVSYIVSATVTGPTGTSPAGAAKPVIAGDVPGVPTLAALAGIGSVQLSWNTPNGNGLPVIGYTVSYAIGSGTPTVVKAKAVNLLMIKGLLRGTAYTFSIQATNLQGNSDLSNSVTATPT